MEWKCGKWQQCMQAADKDKDKSKGKGKGKSAESLTLTSVPWVVLEQQIPPLGEWETNRDTCWLLLFFKHRGYYSE